MVSSMAAHPPPPPTIATVDLSSILTSTEGGDAAAREAVTRAVATALQSTGFFRVANHGVPPELMARAFEVSRDFFRHPDEEKFRSGPVEGSPAPVPVGYTRQPEASPDKNEYLLMFPPETGFNVYPADPPLFREVMEELFVGLRKLASLVEDILNECMGLPPNFLKEYNGSQSTQFMVALRYFPATDSENTGLTQHKDANILTFLFEDDVGGLEVFQDGEWIPAAPQNGTIIVNIGDIIQVLSNNRFQSALHRVVRKSVHRHSFAFFHTLDGSKWVEPLKQFTEAAGEKPKFRGFLYEEYLQRRLRNKTHPPARKEDIIDVYTYAIPSGYGDLI